MNGIHATPHPSRGRQERLPAATYLLTLCQAINLTAAVVSVTIAALVGSKLAPNHAWATVPYGLQFASVAIATYPAASFMRRYGRKRGFQLGAMFLIAAGCIVRSAIASGEIVPGRTTVIEKTGGNFGFGLALACQAHAIPVELAVGLGFSAVKRRPLSSLGTCKNAGPSRPGFTPTTKHNQIRTGE